MAYKYKNVHEIVRSRVLEVGEFIAATGTTVREAGIIFGVCKSTIHRDCRERLPEIDPVLYKEVDKTLNINKEERNIRGGKATREKFLRLKCVKYNTQ